MTPFPTGDERRLEPHLKGAMGMAMIAPTIPSSEAPTMKRMATNEAIAVTALRA